MNAIQHVPDLQHPDRERFYPLTATDPVGVTTDLETPSGAFSHDITFVDAQGNIVYSYDTTLTLQRPWNNNAAT